MPADCGVFRQKDIGVCFASDDHFPFLCEGDQEIYFYFTVVLLAVNGIEDEIGFAWFWDVDCEIAFALKVHFEGKDFMAEFAD
jgi:hypothetical protein